MAQILNFPYICMVTYLNTKSQLQGSHLSWFEGLSPRYEFKTFRLTCTPKEYPTKVLTRTNTKKPRMIPVAWLAES